MQHDGKKGLNVQDQRLVELVRQFQKGDSGAFDKIFSLAYSNVYFMVYKMMRDHYEAEDVTQEVFTNIFNHLNELKEPQTFKKWMNQIAWHTTLDYLKSRRRNSTAGCDIDTLLETNQLCPDLQDDGKQILDAERKNVVMGAIDQLNPMLRITVLLRFFNDLKEREIAEIMNVPLGTVKRRLMIAKQQLSGKLTGVYSIFPYFFVRLAASKECRETASVLGTLIPAKLIGKTALLTGFTAGAVAAVVIHGPVIGELKYYGNESYVNEQRVQWKIDSSVPLKSVKFLERDWNISEENGLYWADISENGVYTLCVTDSCGQSAVQQIRIDNIDADSPIYCSYEERGDQMLLRFQDSCAGINWSTARFVGADGREAPVQMIDQQRGEVVLPLDAFPLQAEIEDLAGNYGVYKLELNSIQIKERQEEQNESA